MNLWDAMAKALEEEGRESYELPSSRVEEEVTTVNESITEEDSQ